MPSKLVGKSWISLRLRKRQARSVLFKLRYNARKAYPCRPPTFKYMMSVLKFTVRTREFTRGTALVVRPLWCLLVELLNNVLAC